MLLPLYVWAIRVAHEPIAIGKQPCSQTEVGDDFYDLRSCVSRDQPLLHDSGIWLHDHAAVESSYRFRHIQRASLADHSAWRTATGQREADSGGFQSLHGR